MVSVLVSVALVTAVYPWQRVAEKSLAQSAHVVLTLTESVPSVQFPKLRVGSSRFLFTYAYLHGMADTVQEFPVIAYSGMTASDRGYILFLLGEDDKTFAFLNLKLNDKLEVTDRNIFYVPRTEVKWMAVIRYMPIYRVADINDLLRLAEQVKKSNSQ